MNDTEFLEKMSNKNPWSVRYYNDFLDYKCPPELLGAVRDLYLICDGKAYHGLYM